MHVSSRRRGHSVMAGRVNFFYFSTLESLQQHAHTSTTRVQHPGAPSCQQGRGAGKEVGGSGQGQPCTNRRGCLVSASREALGEGAAMRSLVRRHRGFTVSSEGFRDIETTVFV